MKDHAEGRPEDASKLAYSVDELVRLTSLGRTLIYNEIREGRLVPTKRGRRTIFTRESVRAWLALPDGPNREPR
jgi:predicted DNA-binding transcriptional regulator AlpA